MPFRRRCSAAASLLAATLAIAVIPASAQDRAFQFGLVGDTGYSEREEADFERVIAALNTTDLAFVIHVGDFQNDPRPHNRNPDRSSVPCVEESYKRVLASFQRVRHPFIVTPGDNDWADCHHLKSVKVDPLEALAAVRKTFYPKGKSVGQRTIAVESQAADPAHAKFVENLRWSMGGVTFASVHVVGSNDNLGRSPEMDAEHAERKAANLAWIKAAFAKARAAQARRRSRIIRRSATMWHCWSTSWRATTGRSPCCTATLTCSASTSPSTAGRPTECLRTSPVWKPLARRRCTGCA